MTLASIIVTAQFSCYYRQDAEREVTLGQAEQQDHEARTRTIGYV